MDGDAFGEDGAGGGFPAGQLKRGGAQMLVFAPGREQVIARVGGTPVAAQYLEEARREHGVAVLGTLALLNPQESTLGIDVGNAQRESFADAQASSVADHKGGTVLEAGDVVE